MRQLANRTWSFTQNRGEAPAPPGEGPSPGQPLRQGPRALHGRRWAVLLSSSAASTLAFECYEQKTVRKKLIELKREIDWPTVITGGFNTHLSEVDRTNSHKINKCIEKLKTLSVKISHVEVLSLPHTSEYDPIWRQGLFSSAYRSFLFKFK